MACPYCGLNYMPAQHKCSALDPEWQAFDMVCPTCKVSWAGVERVLAERNRLRAEVAQWKAAAEKATQGQTGWARCFEYEREVTALKTELARLTRIIEEYRQRGRDASHGV